MGQPECGTKFIVETHQEFILVPTTTSNAKLALYLLKVVDTVGGVGPVFGVIKDRVDNIRRELLGTTEHLTHHDDIYGLWHVGFILGC